MGRVLPLILGVLVFGYSISEVLATGYLGDDRFDTIKAWIASDASISPWARSLDISNNFVSDMGKFHPVAHLVGSYSFLIEDRQTFKSVGFVLTLLALALFAKFISLWTRSTLNSLFFLILAAVFIQFKVLYDPLIGMGIHTKVLVLILGTQLVLLAKMREPTSSQLLIWPYLILTCVVTLYHEVGVLAQLAFVPLFREIPWRQRRLLFGAGLSINFFYFILRVVLWFNRTTDFDSDFYKLNLSPLGVAETYLKQLVAVIPFSSSFSLENFDLGLGLVDISMFILVTALLVFGLSLLPPRNRVKQSPWTNELFILGSLLIILPPLPIALSVGFGKSFQWGDGYIQVWIGQIGLSIVVFILLRSFLGRLIRSRRMLIPGVVLSLLMAISVIGSAQLNSSVIRDNPYQINDNKVHGWEREVGEKAIKEGLLQVREVPQSLYALPARQWLNTETIRILSKGAVSDFQNPWPIWGEHPTLDPSGCLVDETTGLNKLRTYSCDQTSDFFFVRASSFDSGFALVSNLSQLSLNASEEWNQEVEYRAEVSSGYLYVTSNLRKCRFIIGQSSKHWTHVADLTPTQNPSIVGFTFPRAVRFEDIEFSNCF